MHSSMKRIFSFLAAAAFIVSCEISEPIRPEAGSETLPAYTGTFSDWSTFVFTSDEVKTVHSGNTILWSQGDKIRMAYTVGGNWQGADGDATQNSPAKLYESDALASAEEIASFTVPGQFPSSGSGAYDFYTIYPSSAAENDDNFADAPLTDISIPSEQTPPATSFDPAADLMIGHSTGTYSSKPTGAIPIMWERKVAHGEITLKSIKGFSDTETIESVTLTAQSGAYLTGLFFYDFSTDELVEDEAYNFVTVDGDNLSGNNGNLTFWISICPVEITSLTITLETDAATYTNSYSGISRTFKANARNTLNIGMSKATRTAKKQYYEKVTSAPTDWSGEYLIVYEGGSVAFDGGLSTLDAVSNTIDVTISDGKIEKTATTEAAQFTIAPITGGYSIKSASGKYIGNDSNSNSLTSSNNALVNTLSFSSGTVNVISSGGAYLRYNSQSGQTRFRYFKSSSYSGQQAIQLYKLGSSSGGGETPPDPQPATATVTTAAAGNIAQTTATLNGSYSGNTGPITEAGFYWGETNNPTTKVTSSGTNSPFTYNLTGLTANKTYYFQAYVIEYGEEIKGNVVSFTTEAEQQSGSYYVKVTSEPSDWSGDYLIVYETGNKAFNGGLTTLDANNNIISVTISNNKIEKTSATQDAQFTIASVSGGYSIKSASGYYIGTTSNSNSLASSSSIAYVNTLTYSSGDVTIKSSNNIYLRYNTGGPRFRYYGSGQQAVQLYKLSGSSTPQVTVTTGSASSIGQDSATLNGSYTVPTGLSVTERGFYFGTDSNSMTKVSVSGSGTSFSTTRTGLSEGTTYYFKAYALENNNGTTTYRYGDVQTFTTSTSGSPSTGYVDWAELPELDYTHYTTNGNYYIDNSTHGNKYASNTLYYTHHWTDVQYSSGSQHKNANGQYRYLRNYTCCWSSAKKCPVWIAAARHSCWTGSSGRTNAYKQNPDMPSSIQYSGTSASNNSYNRGHMLGSAERTLSKLTNNQVFYTTNIAPQHGTYFNTGGGGWNNLEDWVDGQVCSDTLYVVIGCLFDDFTDGYGNHASPSTISFMGTSGVACPTAFYYALLRTKSGNSGKSVKNCSASELKCAAFVRAQASGTKGQAVTATEMKTIAELEELTGFTFFSNVPNAPKTTKTASDWGL